MSANISSSSITLLPPAEPAYYYKAGDVDVLTVPANKTFFVTGIAIYNRNSSANTQAQLRIDGTIVFLTLLVVGGQANLEGYPIFTVEAGETLSTQDFGTSSKGSYHIWGFMQ